MEATTCGSYVAVGLDEVITLAFYGKLKRFGFNRMPGEPSVIRVHFVRKDYVKMEYFTIRNIPSVVTRLVSIYHIVRSTIYYCNALRSVH